MPAFGEFLFKLRVEQKLLNRPLKSFFILGRHKESLLTVCN